MSPTTLSRRTFGKVLAGAAVTGFHVGSSSWVSAEGQPSSSPFQRLPRLLAARRRFDGHDTLARGPDILGRSC